MAVSPDPASILFSAATAGIEQPAQEYVLPRASSLAAPSLNWLWPGYVPGGKLTLIDARGGTGKTRLALGMMACLSIGSWPFGIGGQVATCEPARSMLITSEDDPEDSALTFREMGGDLDQLILYSPDTGALTLDDSGLTQLEAIIIANQLRMVVFDPVLQYMPGTVRGQTDNQGITQTLSKLQRVARSTGVAIVLIRHWAMSQTDREASQLGAGGESWRNSSRAQIILFPHPENATRRDWTQVLAVSGRNTQRVVYEQFFGIEIERGRQTFIHPDQVDLDPYLDSFKMLARHLGKAPPIDPGARGPEPEVTRQIATAIIDAVRARPRIYRRDLVASLIEAGHAKTTVYRAVATLLEQGHLVEEKWQLSLANEDMFADDAATPWWLE